MFHERYKTRKMVSDPSSTCKRPWVTVLEVWDGQWVTVLEVWDVKWVTVLEVWDVQWVTV